MPQTLSKELKFPHIILLLIIMYNFSPFYWIIILLFSQIINLISLIKSIDPGYLCAVLRLCHTIFEKRISTVPSTTIIIIIIIIIINYIYIALFWVLKVLYIEEAGGGGGDSSTTTSVQHPPGWCDGSHIAPERPPHTSLLVERRQWCSQSVCGDD